MGHFFTTVGDHWFEMGIISVGSVILFLVLMAACFIWWMIRECASPNVRCERDEGDSYYDQTKREALQDNKRLLEDLEAEKKFNHDIVTVKNTVLNENAELREMIVKLCDRVDEGRNNIASYDGALRLVKEYAARIELDKKNLQKIIEAGADEYRPEIQEMLKSYKNGSQDNKIKMENVVCAG